MSMTRPAFGPSISLMVAGLVAVWALHGAPPAFASQSSDTSPPAQDPAPAKRQGDLPVFRATANLVTVDAVVTDKDGRHVTDLTAEDFEVVHAGEPQQLRHAVYVALGTDPFGSGGATIAAAEMATPTTHGESLGRAVQRHAPPVERTIAIVVDDLGLSFESMAGVRRGLRRFIDEQMSARDLIAIIRTSGGIGTLQQFTRDRRHLHAAVERLRWTVTSRSGIGAFAPVETGDVYVDASRGGGGFGPGERAPGASFAEGSIDEARHRVFVAGSLGALDFVARGMQNLPGRKAVVFISEGFDLFARLGEARTWAAFTRLMDQANRGGIVVYTMDARGLETGGLMGEDNPQLPVQEIPVGPGGGIARDQRLRQLLLGVRDARETLRRNSEEALHYMAWQTGGFAILNNNRVQDALGRVVADLQGFYLLGYEAPPGGGRGWDPDRIRVSVKRPGLRVRSRRGFFGPAEAESDAPASPADRLLLAAMSPFGSAGITLRLTPLFAHDPESGAYVRSLLFIDPAGLTFTKGEDGHHEGAAEIVQIAVGDNGEVVGDWRRRVTLRLTDDQLRDAYATGVLYSTRMTVKDPGGYQIRAAVLDVASSRIGSASQFLEVPEVGRGGLALSGLLLQARGDAASVGEASLAIDAAGENAVRDVVLGKPSLRIYRPGTDVLFAYEIYDGTGASELHATTTLIRDGRVVHSSDRARLEPRERSSPLRVVPVGGLLSLGSGVPPGTYTLEVSVAAGTKRRAAQWIDLEVRR